jgi:undecaprenyl-diphosphatase
MIAALDRAGVRWARSLPHARGLDRLLSDYSRGAEHGRLWLALRAVAALRDRRCRAQWLTAIAAVLAAEAASQAVKRLVRRERPRLLGLPPLAGTPSPFSFPSAHTASAVAAAIAAPRGAVRRGIGTGALAMAASRPYLGVHYPSDVLAGAALGAAAASLVMRLRRRSVGSARR